MLRCLLRPHACACAAFKHYQHKIKAQAAITFLPGDTRVTVLNPPGGAGAAPGKEAGQEAPHACSGLQVHSKVCAAALC